VVGIRVRDRPWRSTVSATGRHGVDAVIGHDANLARDRGNDGKTDDRDAGASMTMGTTGWAHPIGKGRFIKVQVVVMEAPGSPTGSRSDGGLRSTNNGVQP